MRQCKIRESASELEDVLRARGIKLQKGKKVIDRLINVKPGKIIRNNPEKKYHKDKPNLDSLQHYSQSEFSMDDQSQRVQPLARALPRQSRISSSLGQSEQNQQVSYMSNDAILTEKARKFIARLRKQKEYEWGKVLLHRKKEEELRKKRYKAFSEQREREQAHVRLEKYKKMMDSILYHEERIGFRMKNSFSRYRPAAIRSSTEGSDDLSSKYQISRSAMFDYERDEKESRIRTSELPAVVSLRQRLANLSSMIDSLQK